MASSQTAFIKIARYMQRSPSVASARRDDGETPPIADLIRRIDSALTERRPA